MVEAVERVAAKVAAKAAGGGNGILGLGLFSAV
jgi:hypothetical protein